MEKDDKAGNSQPKDDKAAQANENNAGGKQATTTNAPPKADPPKPEPEKFELPEGVVRVMHPDGASASWRGKSYTPTADGSFIVPTEAAADLASHGFEVVS